MAGTWPFLLDLENWTILAEVNWQWIEKHRSTDKIIIEHTQTSQRKTTPEKLFEIAPAHHFWRIPLKCESESLCFCDLSSPLWIKTNDSTSVPCFNIWTNELDSSLPRVVWITYLEGDFKLSLSGGEAVESVQRREKQELQQKSPTSPWVVGRKDREVFHFVFPLMKKSAFLKKCFSVPVKLIKTEIKPKNKAKQQKPWNHNLQTNPQAFV